MAGQAVYLEKWGRLGREAAHILSALAELSIPELAKSADVSCLRPAKSERIHVIGLRRRALQREPETPANLRNRRGRFSLFSS